MNDEFEALAGVDASINWVKGLLILAALVFSGCVMAQLDA